ncbi:MAG: peptide ABC transporter substrate-binding protein, partial [Actinobacteria bacterium]|nr:peptide ABC transporter substrate-binding protein [Actinomycetota bacterium]
MSLRKLVALVVVLGLLVSLGAGCGGKKAEQPTTKEPEKPKEMVLNYNMGADAKSLDPAAISAVNDSWVIMALFEGMVRNTPDGVKPGMATEWKISDDKKTYT